jgi:hypothetical protein
MPKKQKRFKSEQDILRAIDAMEARRVMRLKDAEMWEAAVKTVSFLDFPSDEEYTAKKDYQRKMANMARRSAQRAENKKKSLGEALSRMRTMLLRFSDNEDTSVVL